jgi:hypothetical protein
VGKNQIDRVAVSQVSEEHAGEGKGSALEKTRHAIAEFYR